MDDHSDRVYMWLTLLTFVGFGVAIAFGFMKIQEYTDTTRIDVPETLFD